MRAIVHGMLFSIVDTVGEMLIVVDPDDSTLAVPLFEPSLVIDPSDDEIEALLAPANRAFARAAPPSVARSAARTR